MSGLPQRFRVATICLLAMMTSMAAPTGGRADEPRQESLPRTAVRIADESPLRIIAFGSSSTEGIGASSPQATYPSRLQVELSALLPQEQIIVLNRGVGGEDSDDMAKRLPAILAEHPDLVIWQTGSNDPLRDVPLDRFIGQTEAGLTTMRAAGVDVMLMEPQYCRQLASKPGSERFRDAIRAIGAKYGVPVIRRFGLMRAWLDKGLVTPAQLLSADGLHMADAGYRLLAAEVAREIVAKARVAARFGTAAR
ncbi:MAG: SGNH/GDSL hydrolase family protein [Alphaproteobacteria bacterium]|nr:SGNH/GDSL hydrolase family protein [Alphaproteobacteria bacterium]